ncbi:urease accessory protein UreF [Campylobacterota bacterium]|nr:urease accessory protein UreF [Campylobacterota bacterium]
MYTATHTKNLLLFTQILDASFPSGAFTHSFGLEPHITSEIVQDIASLKQFLQNIIIYQYTKLEFPIVKTLYDRLSSDRVSLVVKLDNQLSYMLSNEYAKAFKQIGENIFVQIKQLELNLAITKEYFALANAHKTACNELILLGVLAHDIGMSVEAFSALWSKKNLINIAICALKISKIKPTEIQQTLFALDRLLEISIKTSGNRISNFNPLFDHIIYQHSSQQVRLFTT